MGDAQYQYLDGEPDLLESKARRYVEIATAISRSTGTLQAIEDEVDSKSLALDETREKSREVRESIDRAQTRYRTTGDALLVYAASLRDAKSRAATAADQIARLDGDRDDALAAQYYAEQAVNDLPSTATPEEVRDAHALVQRRKGRVAGIDWELRDWRGRWQSAKDDKDAAARTASGQIEDVVTGSKTHGLKDGFWDKVGEVWDSVYKIVKVVCDIAGVLAIFFSWVPFVGQALLILAAVGAILAVVDAAVKFARGEGSFWGVLGAAGLAALTLFGGKAISAVAKYAKARTIVQSTSRLTGSAARSTFGSTAIKSARRVFAQSNAQRVTEVLRSPFARSTTDKALWGMVRNGAYRNAAKTFFPNPFKSSIQRAFLGNGDVIGMLDTMAITGARIDNLSSNLAGIAVIGAHANQVYKGVTNLVHVSQDLNNGDWGDAAKDGLSLGGMPFDGPYGDLVGIGLQGVDGTSFHGLDVSNPTDHAVDLTGVSGGGGGGGGVGGR